MGKKNLILGLSISLMCSVSAYADQGFIDPAMGDGKPISAQDSNRICQVPDKKLEVELKEGKVKYKIKSIKYVGNKEEVQEQEIEVSDTDGSQGLMATALLAKKENAKVDQHTARFIKDLKLFIQKWKKFEDQDEGIRRAIAKAERILAQFRESKLLDKELAQKTMDEVVKPIKKIAETKLKDQLTAEEKETIEKPSAVKAINKIATDSKPKVCLPFEVVDKTLENKDQDNASESSIAQNELTENNSSSDSPSQGVE